MHKMYVLTKMHIVTITNARARRCTTSKQDNVVSLVLGLVKNKTERCFLGFSVEIILSLIITGQKKGLLQSCTIGDVCVDINSQCRGGYCQCMGTFKIIGNRCGECTYFT